MKIKIHPLQLSDGEVSCRGPNWFLYQAVNIFISAVKLDILIWGPMSTDPPVNTPSSDVLKHTSTVCHDSEARTKSLEVSKNKASL